MRVCVNECVLRVCARVHVRVGCMVHEGVLVVGGVHVQGGQPQPQLIGQDLGRVQPLLPRVYLVVLPLGNLYV